MAKGDYSLWEDLARVLNRHAERELGCKPFITAEYLLYSLDCFRKAAKKASKKSRKKRK